MAQTESDSAFVILESLTEYDNFFFFFNVQLKNVVLAFFAQETLLKFSLKQT